MSNHMQLTITNTVRMKGLLFWGLLLLQLDWALSQGLTVTIDVDYTPPPDFVGGPNDYRAASKVTLTCQVEEATGSETYQWSSTCTGYCFLLRSYSETTHTITRYILRSTDSGNHTCTATNPQTGWAGNATIEMNIVGAGIYLVPGRDSSYSVPTGVLPNNGIVIARDVTSGECIVFQCRSGSTDTGVGQLVDLDENSFTIGGNTGVFSVQQFGGDPGHPGSVRIHNCVGYETLTADDEGIYTCRIPDETGNEVDVNIGVYQNGFNTLPTISNVTYDYQGNTPILTCTSTDSPATNVTWTKDGVTLTVGGTKYSMTQTVADRRTSIYENVLTLPTTGDITGSYGCQVGNALGDSETKNVDVKVQRPGPVRSLAAIPQFTSVLLTWDAPHTGNTAGIVYEVQYQQEGDPDYTGVNVTDTSIKLTGLIPQTGYNISVNAYTIAGAGSSTAVEITTMCISGVRVDFHGEEISEHGLAILTHIHTSNGEALQCLTARRDCCSSPEGSWLYPNGSEISTGSDSDSQMYVTRDSGVVRLHRKPWGDGTEGIYQCRIPDGSGTVQIIHIGLYTPDNGHATVSVIEFELKSDITADSLEFTLIGTSTGGPVTTYIWSRDDIELPDNYIKSRTLENCETAAYSLTLSVTGRFPGTYKCLVKTVRPQDSQELSSHTSINVMAVSEPLGVAVIQENPTTIRVSWTAPTSGASPTGYQIYYTTEPEDQFSHEVMIGASEREYVLTGLQSDLVYHISIMALSPHLPSPVIGPMIPVPIAPTVTLEPSSPTRVMITWSYQLEAHSFVILFGRATIPAEQQGICLSAHNESVTVPGETTEHILTGLEEYSTYTINVTAVNKNGLTSHPSIQQVTTFQAAPSGPPQTLRNSSVTVNTITIEWDSVRCIDRNSLITGYIVRYGRASSSVRETVEVSGSGTTGGLYTITGLTQFTNYSIGVAAVSESGTGPFTADILIKTLLDVPHNPRGVRVKEKFATTIKISWNPQTLVHHFAISFIRATGTQQEGNCPSYSHTQSGYTTPGDATEFTVEGLEEYSTYNITLRAVNRVGISGPTTVKVTTQKAAPTGSPQNVRNTTVSSSTVTLYWDDVPCIEQNSDITSYIVQYVPTSSSGSETATTQVQGKEYTITRLTPFTSYSIQVAAVNRDGNTGPQSGSIIVETLQDVPSSVDNAAVTPLLTSLEASWEQPSVPNGIIILYEVCYYQYVMGNVNDVCAVNTNVTEITYKAVGLVPTATYVFRVRAYTVAGHGEWTNKAVTLPNIPAVEGLSVNIVNATALLVHWTALKIQTLSVSLYTVYYKAYSEKRNGIAVELHSVPNNETSFLLNVQDLTPGLQHQFQVTASVEIQGEVIEGEANEDAVVFQEAFFQLQIGPVEYCVSWTPEKAAKLDKYIQGVVAKAVSDHCNCSFAPYFIRAGIFSCRRASNEVSYRSTIVGTETHNTTELLGLIEDWVGSGPVLRIGWYLADVYTNFPVELSSLDEMECPLTKRPITCSGK